MFSEIKIINILDFSELAVPVVSYISTSMGYIRATYSSRLKLFSERYKLYSGTLN
jgi:hypothetical protein